MYLAPTQNTQAYRGVEFFSAMLGTEMLILCEDCTNSQNYCADLIIEFAQIFKKCNYHVKTSVNKYKKIYNNYTVTQYFPVLYCVLWCVFLIF